MSLRASVRNRSENAAVALGTAAIAAIVNGLLWPEFGSRYPLIGFYPAIVVTALLRGAWPGVLCTIASSLVAAVVWLNPRSPMTVSRAADAVALTVFVSVGAVISLLADVSVKRAVRERAARQRAERAEREAAAELADVQRLQRLTETVFRRDAPDAIVQDLLGAAVELVGARAAHVHLVETAGSGLVLRAHCGLSALDQRRLTMVEDGYGPIGEAFALRCRLAVENGGLDNLPELGLYACPVMTAEGRALGVLTTYQQQTAVQKRADRFLDACVQQAAQALERCRLLDGERRARHEAEAASRLKDNFLSTVSHELRTPLNAVLGWAEMLRTGRLAQAAEARALRAIADNARRQMQLIGELLDVSRITAGTLRLQTTDVDVTDIVRKAAEVIEPAAAAKSLRVSIEGPDTRCRADAGRLQQVLWNLLTNAVKFTPIGGAIQVAVRLDRDTVEIHVRDSGRGIHASFIPHLFEPFRQGDASTTRSEGGLGLGLSIVKHLVEAHGGTIGAESAGEGEGACFTVRLPASNDRSTTTKAPRAELQSSKSTLTGLSILLIEDDADSREVLAVSLEDAGASVRASASAREGMELLLHHEFDIILADIAMPEQDGYSFIQQVRAWPTPGIGRTPAIALTSLAREKDVQDALTAGFQLHLMKPISPDELAQAVARVVEQSHRARPA